MLYLLAFSPSYPEFSPNPEKHWKCANFWHQFWLSGPWRDNFDSPCCWDDLDDYISAAERLESVLDSWLVLAPTPVLAPSRKLWNPDMHLKKTENKNSFGGKKRYTNKFKFTRETFHLWITFYKKNFQWIIYQKMDLF